MRIYEIEQTPTQMIAVGDIHARGVASALHAQYHPASHMNEVSSLLGSLHPGTTVVLSIGQDALRTKQTSAGTLVNEINTAIESAKSKNIKLVYILFPEFNDPAIDDTRNSIKQSINTYVFDLSGGERTTTGGLSSSAYLTLASSIQSNLQRINQYADRPATNPASSSGNLKFSSHVNTAINSQLTNMVSKIFSIFGRPFPIISGYRSPQYNKNVGGAKNSAHTRGNAVDIDVSSLPIKDRIRLIQIASSVGVTGIGVYKTSLHFDVEKRRAWGPSYHWWDIPDWAKPSISMHMQNRF